MLLSVISQIADALASSRNGSAKAAIQRSGRSVRFTISYAMPSGTSMAKSSALAGTFDAGTSILA